MTYVSQNSENKKQRKIEKQEERNHTVLTKRKQFKLRKISNHKPWRPAVNGTIF